MYKYEDFKDNIDIDQLLKIVSHAQECFAESWSGEVELSELIKAEGCNTWMKLACIDKLHELGYIAVVKYGEISNGTTYMDVRL